MVNRSEKGYTLAGVLLIFTIVSILGMSLVTLSLASVKTSTSERDNQSVYYVAEAGLNYQLNKIEKEREEAEKRILSAFSILDSKENATAEDYYDVIESELDSLRYKLLKTNEFIEEYNEFEKVNNIQPRAEFEIMESDEEHKYELRSIGFIGDESRTVTTIFLLGWDLELEEIEEELNNGELPPFAVFTSGQFTMSNGRIDGDIGTISNKEKAIQFPGGGPTLNGDIYVPNGDNSIVENKATGNIFSSIEEINQSYNIPDLPLFPSVPNDFIQLPDRKATNGSSSTDVIKNNNLNVVNWITNNYVLEVEENLEFNSINLNQNNTLYLDLGDKDKEIVVNKLNILNGHIKLKGTGNLTIYVKDELIMGAGSSFNQFDNIENLNIFYEGNKIISLAGNQKVFGSLYAKEADLALTGSGGIYGNVFTGGDSVKLDGGSDILAQLILAPKAKVEVLAGGHVKGRIISNSFEMKGGGRVILDEPFVIDGPISPNVLNNGNNNPGNGENSGSHVKLIGAKLNLITAPLREQQ